MLTNILNRDISKHSWIQTEMLRVQLEPCKARVITDDDIPVYSSSAGHTRLSTSFSLACISISIFEWFAIILMLS